MDILSLFFLLLFVWTASYVFISYSGGRNGGTVRLPPGPYPFPVIGNILALGKSPHLSLTRLSKIYGPLMSLKLGLRTTIVVSSPQLAKEVLQKHDHVFSSRSVPDCVLALDHHNFSLAWLPESAPWRNLRKICKEHIFSVQKLDSSLSLRQQKVQQLIDYVQECCENGQAVNIGKAAFTTILNLLSNTFFSMDSAQYHAESSQEIKDLGCAATELAGKPNPVDFFPLLKFIDPLGIRRKGTYLVKKLFLMFDRIIDEKEWSLGKAPSVGKMATSRDFLELALNLNKENDTQLISRNEAKHLFFDLFVAGTDTMSSTIEWAMFELLKNPAKLAKARAELKETITEDSGGKVQESDISRLPYLQAVVKETFRLHPPVPFLVPHRAGDDTEIGGYLVPKNAQIFVNVWAMGRDPNIWPDPDSFVPERFLDRDIDFRGTNFELIPFGAGRRICPGLPLAYRMLHLMLGSLLLSFDWKLGDGNEDLDMREKFGITLQKAVPLKAIPIQG